MARGITQIRKETTEGHAVDARKIAQLFKAIADKHPEIVAEVLRERSPRTFGTLDEGKMANMIEFYKDMADYLAEHFNYS